jgi:Chaperone of endosialidase
MKIAILLLCALYVFAGNTKAQNVGIGTTTPIARLEVKGIGKTDTTNTFILRNSEGDTLLRMRDDNRMGIGYNGTSYGRTLNLGGSGINFYTTNGAVFGGAIFPTDTSLILWSNSNPNNNLILQPSWGKVGIGTYNPSSKLEVVGTDTTDIKISASYNGFFGPTRLSFISDKNTPFEWRPGFIESADNGGGFGFNGRLDFYTNGSGPNNKFGRAKAMSIINDYVELPNKLQITNSGANRKIVLYETANNDNQYYGFGINGATLRYQIDDVIASHKFYAGTSPTTSNELLRIQGTGDVGIGTSAAASTYGHGGTNRILELKNTAPAGSNVQSHLILSTSANSGSMGGVTWVGTGLSGEQRTGFIGNVYETVNQTRLTFYTRDNAGALNERFYIQGTGNAWLAGTLTQASDARLKKNIQPLSSTLKNLNQINGYTYNWINEQKDSEQQIGLLAQEVQKIYPQLVKQNDKGELSVNYTGLVPVLLEGMKELQKQIDELKEIVTKLIKTN